MAERNGLVGLVDKGDTERSRRRDANEGGGGGERLRRRDANERGGEGV